MSGSYAIYMATVIIASLFASLAQKYSKINKNYIRVPNNLFWFISMAILIFIMGFREYSVGVDGASYIRIYEIINSMPIIDYYMTGHFLEPGYLLLNKLIGCTFNDYQWVFVISATLTIACFYKAISYEIQNMDLGLVVLIFASTQYFYYFGIMRMGIATSIVAVAYRNILEKKLAKYIVLVLLASMFHFSALFALTVIFINSKSYKFKDIDILKIAIIIPTFFLCIRFFAYSFLATISRYQRYIANEGLLSLGFLTSSLPFLVIFLIFYKSSLKKHRNYNFYFLIFMFKFFSELFIGLVGIGRIVWYFNLSLCFLLPGLIRGNRDYTIKLLVLAFTLMYCVTYSYHAYFGDSPRGLVMLPYNNIFLKDTWSP